MNIDSILSVLNRIWNYQLFQIDNRAVTTATFLIFFLIIVGFHIGIRLLSRLVLVRIMRRLKVEESTQYMLRRLLYYVLMLTGLMVAVQFVGIDMTGLAVVAGFLSLGIGFGLQNVTSNFVAGLILLFQRPIRVGDHVTVDNTEGEIMEIHLRSTTIRTLNNISIIVPNSAFVENSIINWSHGDSRIRIDIPVGVSYSSDLNLVLNVLKDAAVRHRDTLSDPEPDVLLSNFGDSSWDMVLRAWIQNPKRHHDIQSEIRCEIVRAFRANGIAIPFPQREVRMLDDSTKAPPVKWKSLGS